MARNITYVPVSVADSGTTSNAIDTSEHEVVGVYLPTGLEGTTLGFTASPAQNDTDLPYVTVHSASGAFSQTVAAGTYAAIDPDLLAGARWVKVVLAAQTGAYTAHVALRRLGA